MTGKGNNEIGKPVKICLVKGNSKRKTMQELFLNTKWLLNRYNKQILFHVGYIEQAIKKAVPLRHFEQAVLGTISSYGDTFKPALS